MFFSLRMSSVSVCVQLADSVNAVDNALQVSLNGSTADVYDLKVSDISLLLVWCDRHLMTEV